MRAARWCLAIVLPLLATAGCERAGSATYRPPFVPVEFAVDTTGEVGISAGREVVTPLGTFGLKAQVKKDLSEDDTMVVIKHEVGGDTRKDVFVLDQQGGSACLNGTAVLTAGPANTIDLFVLAGSTVRIVDAATAPDACRETGRGPDTVVTGVDAWVAQLASLRDTSGPEVVERTRQELSAGLGRPISVVRSGDYASLRAGWWMFYYAGGFADGHETLDFCARNGRTRDTQCVGRWLSRDAADRVLICHFPGASAQRSVCTRRR